MITNKEKRELIETGRSWDSPYDDVKQTMIELANALEDTLAERNALISMIQEPIFNIYGDCCYINNEDVLKEIRRRVEGRRE